MKLRYKLGLVFFILAGGFLWGRCGRKVSTVPQPASVLPVRDSEQIIVDPSHNSLIITTGAGRQTLFLPSKPTVIDIHKDGNVKVTSPQYGFEHRLFVGGLFADKGRLAIGLDGAYWKKLDIGLGLAGNTHLNETVGFVAVTYNVYSNLQIGVTYDSKAHIGGLLTVRI